MFNATCKDVSITLEQDSGGAGENLRHVYQWLDGQKVKISFILILTVSYMNINQLLSLSDLLWSYFRGN